MIAKWTLLTTQLTPSGCLNSRLLNCVTLVISTKGSGVTDGGAGGEPPPLAS